MNKQKVGWMEAGKLKTTKNNGVGCGRNCRINPKCHSPSRFHPRGVGKSPHWTVKLSASTDVRKKQKDRFEKDEHISSI